MLNKKEDLELERFTKNKKRKFILIGLILGISVTIGGIFLYKSYAYYENEKEYNVIKGIIPDFSYDVKFAVTVDGEKKDTIPKSSDTNNDKYYRVEATCDNGEKAEWDYNAWSIKVSNLQDGTKCKLAFTSDLSKEELDEYIEAGVTYRRNTYRGKDITSKLKDKSLFSEIQSGHFDDIYVGDYITSQSSQKDVNGNTVVWLIADLDNYLHTGDDGHELTQHHATIIPAAPLTKAQMNTTATTTGGYAGSTMVGYGLSSLGNANINSTHNGTLDTIFNNYISKDFNGYVITYSNLLTTCMNPDLPNRTGTKTGISCGWAWYDRQLDLMSEVNVFGETIFSSSGHDMGIDSKQYAIFHLKPEFINTDLNGKRNWYWLKDIMDSQSYADVYHKGNETGPAFGDATTSTGVRPRFLID